MEVTSRRLPNVAELINRGFGGSELADDVEYADEIVIPYRHRAVVLYAGDNIASGKTPEMVLGDFAAFRARRLHAALPSVRLFYLSIKFSPSRATFQVAMKRTNELIAADCPLEPTTLNSSMLTPRCLIQLEVLDLNSLRATSSPKSDVLRFVGEDTRPSFAAMNSIAAPGLTSRLIIAKSIS